MCMRIHALYTMVHNVLLISPFFFTYEAHPIYIRCILSLFLLPFYKASRFQLVVHEPCALSAASTGKCGLVAKPS
jgi:hypothetical protein